jgi:hypothetical protein
VTVIATDTIAIGGSDREGNPSGLFSLAQFGTGRGGDLVLSAPTVRLEGGAISAQSFGRGRAGDLVLTAGRLEVTGGAQLDSRATGTGRVGQLRITASDTILLTGRDSLHDLPSGLFSADLGGSGAPGSVVIATPHQLAVAPCNS